LAEFLWTGISDVHIKDLLGKWHTIGGTSYPYPLDVKKFLKLPVADFNLGEVEEIPIVLLKGNGTLVDVPSDSPARDFAKDSPISLFEFGPHPGYAIGLNE
jgi:hypothetical protein